MSVCCLMASQCILGQVTTASHVSVLTSEPPLSVFTRFSEGGLPHLPFTPSRRGHCQVQGSARNSSSFSLSFSCFRHFWKTGKQLAKLHFVGARLSRFSFSCFIYHTPAFSLLHHALISLQPPWEIVLVCATHSALV
uniref:Putative secreted protein n=1 Tax=Ixodes ricinus TaxID=34613 RepID=A0A6B0USN1_IXORI